MVILASNPFPLFHSPFSLVHRLILMQSALVLGNAISTVKHPSLDNLKLLVCQPLAADRRSRDGAPLLAVDHLGAGAGDMVMITSDGGAVRELYGLENSPIRWAVLGLIDDEPEKPDRGGRS
jgi:ethanolamine utilization protein EutN